MSLFIATGTNVGDKFKNLKNAKDALCENFQMIAESRIYQSAAIEYLNQPDFFNQVLEFKLPSSNPNEVMNLLLELELKLGRIRGIQKGPRIIDLDILFWGLEILTLPDLIVPHPRLFERSFVVLPLSELPGFKTLQKKFSFSFIFENSSTPIS